MNEKSKLTTEQGQGAAEYLKAVLAIVKGESDTCVQCGAKAEKFEQVRRSVYARPCGHRQYRGDAP